MAEKLALSFDDLYATTGEDKLDDLNFAIGIASKFAPSERAAKYATLVNYLEGNRAAIEASWGYSYDLIKFPKLYLVDLFIRGILEKRYFDKQGKSFGMALLYRLTTTGI